MHIQINTDNHIVGHDTLTQKVTGSVAGALDRFAKHITRVEVHLSDENGNKQGIDDKRCVLEARLEGYQPLAVTHRASTIDEAVDGAADKLHRLIESTLGRLRS